MGTQKNRPTTGEGKDHEKIPLSPEKNNIQEIKDTILKVLNDFHNSFLSLVPPVLKRDKKKMTNKLHDKDHEEKMEERKGPAYNESLRKEIVHLIDGEICDPQELIDVVKKVLPGVYEKSVGVAEGYTLEQHTLMVLGQFEKYFSQAVLPNGITRAQMRLLLALHDVGKPTAVELDLKENISSITGKLMKDFFQCISQNPREDILDPALYSALVAHDPIGRYLRGRTTVKKAVSQIDTVSRLAKKTPEEIYQILRVIYMVDAGSYTTDAGGMEALDALFVFSKGEMHFAPDTERKIHELEAEVLRHGKHVARMNIVEEGFLSENPMTRKEVIVWFNTYYGPLEDRGEIIKHLEERKRVLVVDDEGMLREMQVDEWNNYRFRGQMRFFPSKEKFETYYKKHTESTNIPSIDILSLPGGFKYEDLTAKPFCIDHSVLEEAKELVNEGLTSRYFTGTNSASLDGIKSSEYTLLSSQALVDKDIQRRSGEGGTGGGNDLASQVYGAVGHEGLATAFSYALGRESLVDYKKLFHKDCIHIYGIILSRIEDAVREDTYTIDELNEYIKASKGKGNKVWDGVVSKLLKKTYEEKKHFFIMRLREWKEHLYFHELESKNMVHEKRFPIIFGFTGDGHPTVMKDQKRTLGEALSGEVIFGPHMNFAESGLADVFVPKADIPAMERYLKKGGFSDVKLHSTEALLAAMQGGDPTAFEVLKESMELVHLENAAGTVSMLHWLMSMDQKIN